MSSCLEFEAKAVDKAVKKASEALNIPIEKLQYNIISYGSSGIFGLVGVKKARISVTVPEDVASETAADAEEAVPCHVEAPEAGAGEEGVDADGIDGLLNDLGGPTSDHVASLVDEAFGLEKPAETHPAEAVATGKEALRRIIDFITSGAEIHVEAGEDRILFNVEGGNAGVLIGKRGQTLEAIQYLVEKIVNRQSDTRIRIQIDVEGYLNNRRENLKNLARKLSEKAKSTGKPATIGQMNAHDRRIIHLTLKNDQGVRTQSIGDGFYRKLVIFPKKRRKKQNL
jgi:spoIIIJ-associated protein